MANNCCVGIQIVTCNADCGEYLYDHLKVAKMAADAEKTGLYIGCRERRLFDAEIFRDGDTLFISGWSRTGFTDADVKIVIAWMTVQMELKNKSTFNMEPIRGLTMSQNVFFMIHSAASPIGPSIIAILQAFHINFKIMRSFRSGKLHEHRHISILLK